MQSKKESSTRGVIAKVVRSTGVVARNPGDGLKVVTDYIADKIEGNAQASIIAGLEYLNAKGSIGSEFLESSENRYFTLKIKADISNYANDELKLNYKIGLFLAIVSGEIKGNEIEQRRIWQLIDNLTEAELAVLATCVNLVKSRESKSDGQPRRDAREWLNLVAEKSGLKHEPFVIEAENGLTNKSLLEPRDGLNQVDMHSSYRLTPLGLAVADYIEKGQEILDAAANKKEPSRK